MIIDYEQAEQVLKQAQLQLIKEIERCGSSGGIGRAQNYAPVLVNVTEAYDIIKKLNHAEKMRAAKKD